MIYRAQLCHDISLYRGSPSVHCMLCVCVYIMCTLHFVCLCVFLKKILKINPILSLVNQVSKTKSSSSNEESSSDSEDREVKKKPGAHVNKSQPSSSSEDSSSEEEDKKTPAVSRTSKTQSGSSSEDSSDSEDEKVKKKSQIKPEKLVKKDPSNVKPTKVPVKEAIKPPDVSSETSSSESDSDKESEKPVSKENLKTTQSSKIKRITNAVENSDSSSSSSSSEEEEEEPISKKLTKMVAGSTPMSQKPEVKTPSTFPAAIKKKKSKVVSLWEV